jgi:hypothetical protein
MKDIHEKLLWVIVGLVLYFLFSGLARAQTIDERYPAWIICQKELQVDQIVHHADKTREKAAEDTMGLVKGYRLAEVCLLTMGYARPVLKRFISKTVSWDDFKLEAWEIEAPKPWGYAVVIRRD